MVKGEFYFSFSRFDTFVFLSDIPWRERKNRQISDDFCAGGFPLAVVSVVIIHVGIVTFPKFRGRVDI